ncbi:MAG: Hsp20/alpha crystallin family protein [Anaerolineae bacterium]|nr:Hsp20/alpha crystallin family protein [Anaerolineae bacterium]MCO5197770.1 Hsp20/alpha crystallin family protein [Anaerolineae bacterium]MCO5207687.1 Hsp20/alpha crystallin family protein [Anaerolineae bacterium]
MNIGDLVPWKSNELSERERTTDPFVALRRDMNRLFDNFLDDDWLATWPNLRTERFSPRVNVTENDTAITVSAELPGISEEDVDITLQRDALTIKGEKKAEHEEKGTNFYRIERSFGSFSRTIPLPEGVVDQDNVKATFRDGVLTVELAKSPEAQAVSKRIPVNAG